MADDMVVIREFKEERDGEMVEELERNCEMRMCNKDVSIFTNMTGKRDPLCRIRLYPLHIMLVAELRDTGEVVGVVRGCIKYVGSSKLGRPNLKLGCILGLRVSPNHRRMGIGFALMKSVEEWMAGNGADYITLATEKSNVASTNLFSTKCSYIQFSSLVIFAQKTKATAECVSQDVKIEKLNVQQAISLYSTKLRDKDMYPTDIDPILSQSMSLGTWVIYFKQENWICLQEKLSDNLDQEETPSSWAMFSVWNACDTRKREFQVRNKSLLKRLHGLLDIARDKACLKIPGVNGDSNRLGFLFLYGIYGEGELAGELLRSAWGFALRLAEQMKNCKVVLTEMGVSDPMVEHLAVPESLGLSVIDDLWYIKRVSRGIDDEDGNELREMTETVGNVFVDPRDF